MSRNPVPTLYKVAVRALCEFTAKQGDLDLRFTPSATALEGISGHQAVASRRPGGYESEISLETICENLLVRGRADGFDPHANRLEEVKTFRGDLEAMPANRRVLHWAQAKVYGALLCRARKLSRLDIALVYFDVGTQLETMLVEQHSAEDLETFFVDQCRRFSAWAAQEVEHRAARDAALATLKFPHDGFRSGQRELSEAVYKVTLGGRCLLAQAPTGIGKTVGTLFPMLRAWSAASLDKLFFLTAKTPGRGLALDALRTITSSRRDVVPLRVLELVARDKACEHPDKACHGESCPLARGFFDRLPAARAAALSARAIDKPALRTIALDHQVCPYHLGQELVRWADVVVGDYNHYFDLNALLHGMTMTDGWRVGLLVDEAHNLVNRARAMYSAELQFSTLEPLLATAPRAIRAGLGRLARCWDSLAAAQTTAYAAHDELPPALLGALQNFASAMADHLLAQSESRIEPDPALLRFYFDVLHFLRLHESFGDHSLLDLRHLPAVDALDAMPGDSIWCVRNVVPAPFLRPRFAAAATTTLFSATLQPTTYYQDLLGLPEDLATIDVGSPFGSEQLQVRLATDISTRWTQREQSAPPIADLIATQFDAAPGNYLAFVSSFDYLQQIADELAGRHPQVPQWRQSRAMSELARDQFLERFSEAGRGIGFAVLGGAFAEGIDLPGRRLIGAFVATLGLPQWNPVNEQIKGRMEICFGEDRGHDYTYLFPGLQKVVQAAGRVIRAPEDRGVVWLIDERFRRAKVRSLLPGWWQIG